MGGGYPCFFSSVVAIGIMTALIGDVASHLGCTVGLKDSVTALAFVSLGTSLPGRCLVAFYYSLAYLGYRLKILEKVFSIRNNFYTIIVQML